MKLVLAHIAHQGDSVEAALHRLTVPSGQPLKFIFAASISNLKGDGRRLFACASAFVTPFTSPALHAISGLSNDRYRDGLAQLINARLLGFDESTGRYVLSSPSRQFAATLIKRPRDRMMIYKQLSNYYLSLAESSGNDPSRFPVLELELANIIECVRRDWERRQYEHIVRIALALGYPGFLYIRGYWKELEDMLVLALRAARAERKNLESVKALLDLGWLAFCRGNFKRALLFTRNARSAIVKIRNPRARDEALAKMWDYEGQVQGALGHYRAARTLLERSLAIARSGELRSIQAVTLHNLGTIADLEGNGKASIEYFKQSFELKRQLKSPPSSIAITLLALAVTARKATRYREARQTLSKVEGLATKLADKRILAFYWQERAKLNYVTSGPDAAECANIALRLFSSLGSPRDIAETQKLIASIRDGEALDS